MNKSFYDWGLKRLGNSIKIKEKDIKIVNKIIFEFESFETQKEVRQYIQKCESRHIQQAIYSTFHDGLTQVCFGCKKIRSTIKIYE